MAQMTALRRRMIDDMTVRNLSPATQQSYVYAVAKFSRFFGCSPDRLGIEEVRAYQLHLAGLGWSWSHINQVSCALRFFFGVTLGRPEAFDRIISAKEPKKLPVVLSVNCTRARAKTLRGSIRLAAGGRTAAADGGAGRITLAAPIRSAHFGHGQRQLAHRRRRNLGGLLPLAILGCGNSGVETGSRRQVREESACERQAD